MFFFFTSDIRYRDRECFYINHLSIFLEFCNCFERRFEHILQDNSIKRQYYKDLIYPQSLESSVLDEKLFYKNLNQYSDYNNMLSMLSSRENECICRMIVGQTYKEVAASLGLSHRTVESYIDNIRHKTGLHYKNEIIKYFKNLNL